MLSTSLLLCRCPMQPEKACTSCCFYSCPPTTTRARGPCPRNSSRKSVKAAWYHIRSILLKESFVLESKDNLIKSQDNLRLDGILGYIHAVHICRILLELSFIDPGNPKIFLKIPKIIQSQNKSQDAFQLSKIWTCMQSKGHEKNPRKILDSF